MTTVVHGGYSPSRIRSRARGIRRRFLQRLGVHACDLDAITRERLMGYSTAQAQVDLLMAGGQGGSRNFWTGQNTAHRMLRELEERIRMVGLDKAPAGSKLDEYLAGRGQP